MSIFSFLFGERSNRVESHRSSGQNPELQPLRVPIGPSPWSFRNRSIVVCGKKYQFSETAPKDGKLAGLTSLLDAEGKTLLILDFNCYLRILDDGLTMLWHGSRREGEHQIIFDCFRLSSLKQIPEPRVTAAEIRERKLGAGPFTQSEHWEISSYLEAGVHAISIPYDWSPFEETLSLEDHAEADGYEKMGRAIFAFDWVKRNVQVFPQDWYNTGKYDFGYQWIARVARCTGGSIVGEGVRLGSFELDESNRKVETWLNTNPFHMIQ